MPGTILDTTIAVVDHQPINIATMTDLVRRIVNRARLKRGFTLFTLNLDHVVKRRRDPRFRAGLCASHPCHRRRLACRSRRPAPARRGRAGDRRGSDPAAVSGCSRERTADIPLRFDSRVAGSHRGRADGKRFRRLDIRGTASPPMGFDPTGPAATAFAHDIAASGARLCFVALGAPKQELFADAMAQQVPEVGVLVYRSGPRLHLGTAAPGAGADAEAEGGMAVAPCRRPAPYGDPLWVLRPRLRRHPHAASASELTRISGRLIFGS